MRTASQFIDPSVVMFGKLFLAMLWGGLIGTERAILARQAAGTRTFGLVALGACLFIVIANYVDVAYIGVLSFDPLRVAAAIIMGVGFGLYAVAIFTTVITLIMFTGMWYLEDRFKHWFVATYPDPPASS